jgi:hypothetical protein
LIIYVFFFIFDFFFAFFGTALAKWGITLLGNAEVDVRLENDIPSDASLAQLRASLKMRAHRADTQSVAIVHGVDDDWRSPTFLRALATDARSLLPRGLGGVDKFLADSYCFTRSVADVLLHAVDKKCEGLFMVALAPDAPSDAIAAAFEHVPAGGYRACGTNGGEERVL